MRLQNPSSNEGVRQREEEKEDIAGSENLELSLVLVRLRVYENTINIYNSNDFCAETIKQLTKAVDQQRVGLSGQSAGEGGDRSDSNQ